MTWNAHEFKQKLLKEESGYHIHHPFHVAMYQGKLSPEQIRGWVTNRFYYQAKIPQKDANIIANCPVSSVRRDWLQRIRDHDGDREGEGGIEAWINLGEACGLKRAELSDFRFVTPKVRSAVDDYVTFARNAKWQEGICSSLTELFAPEIHKQRLASWPSHYPWIEQKGLAYFQNRIALAKRDVDQALEIVLSHFNTDALQARAIEILRFKLSVLWRMADGIAEQYAPQLATHGWSAS